MSANGNPAAAAPAVPASAGPATPAAATAPVGKGAGAWTMYRAMVGVGLVCGLAIVGAYVGTKPVIEKNRAAALERAIYRVLPDARSRRTFAVQPDGSFAVAGPGPSAGPAVHAGYDDAGNLVGFALEAQGMGYQDVISLLYGYAPERAAIVGLQILESRETPGLGDKIGIDPAFLANFAALDVSLDAEGRGLANPIVAVKHGEKTGAWQVDGITGATISSKAVAAILNGSASTWAPRLKERMADFAPEGSAP